MSPKELFLRSRERAEKLRAVVKTLWFQDCLVTVRSEMFQHPNLSDEQMKGARLFEEILLTLADEEPESEPLASGINHDIDTVKRGQKAEPQTANKKKS